jgi:tetratricopeptide (TPR) repeat protein
MRRFTYVAGGIITGIPVVIIAKNLNWAIVPALLSMYIVVFASIVSMMILSGVRKSSLIDKKCDPVAFLERIEKDRIKSKKNEKWEEYLNLQISAGLILLGKFEEAKNMLLNIDEKYLSYRNGTYMSHTINLMECYYSLGEIESAERLFEKKVPLITAFNTKTRLSLKMIIAIRFFYLGRYQESRETFEEILSQKLYKSLEIEIAYYLAQIDEKENKIEDSLKRYQRVTEEGNKLWIAEKAKERIEKLNIA